MVLIFTQVADPGIRQQLIVRVANRGELHAIEAEQAGLRGQPEISIAGLADGEDGAARQSLLRMPDAMHVLSECPVRMERAGSRGRRDEHNAERQPDDQGGVYLRTAGSGGSRSRP